MVTNDELHQMVSQNKLEYLLEIHGEGDNLDFKQFYSLKSTRDKAELVSNILAFANTEGGGHIIFGVEDMTYEPVGLQEDVHLDTTDIYNVLKNYITTTIDCRAAEYNLQWASWSGNRRFGILYISEASTIVLPQKQIAYQDDKNRTKILVDTNEIIVRLGAQSCKADQATLDLLIAKKRLHKGYIEDQLHEIEGNLPAREDVTLEFVGRSRELEELRKWFKDPHGKIWVLTGDGGKGKTAIAYEFATELKRGAPRNFEYILWLSARVRRFQDGTVRTIDPNFWDDSSLIDAIVRGYGFDDDDFAKLSQAEKKEQAKELLTELPTLVIADDIDSLEPKNERAILFLVADVASTRSKVLFTSRKIPFGFGENYTYVDGLNKEDGEKFIYSRIRRARLDISMFPPRMVEEIYRVTDGSPLYIEDLLRLCAFLPVEEAIHNWKEIKGERARRYAIQREFEQLNPLSKDIVFACCIREVALSLAEIQVITGLSQEQVMDEMRGIQDLFLVSRLKLIDGEPRFEVNTNTRRLILEVYDKDSRLSELKERYKGLVGRFSIREKGEIQSYIHKAISLQLLNEKAKAEKLLRDALQRYPNNADLTAQLGVIYSHWKPNARLADARQQFKLAQQLGCRQEWMYRTWALMENNEQDWQRAAEVVDKSIAAGITSKEIYALAGIAHAFLGRQFKQSFIPDKAEQEYRKANKLLRQALKNPEELANYADRKWNSRVFRSLVISCDELAAACRSTRVSNRVNSERCGLGSTDQDYCGLNRSGYHCGLIADMHQFIDRWQVEYPDDLNARSEGERLRDKHPIE